MKLKEYLALAGLTATEFGHLIGVSQAAVTRYASGARIPETQTMGRIVEATGGTVTPNDFYDLRLQPKPPHKAHVNEGLMEEAREFGSNGGTPVRLTLESAILDERRRRWREENRQAIAEANAELVERGLWSDDLRLF